MKRRKNKTTNWPRLIIQWGVIAFIFYLAFRHYVLKDLVADFEAYCPFGGIQALGSYLLTQTLACTMTTSQIVMGILLFAGILVFSKLFCSFICPLGTVGEWLGRMGEKLKVRLTITGWADRGLRLLKYALLFVTLYYTLGSSELFCKKFDPYYAAASGLGHDVELWWGIAAIAIFLLGSFFVRLFWCKYLCPLGALSNIFKFAAFFVLIMGVYLIALGAGAEISYVWPLAILCIGGFILEVVKMKSWLTPVVRITRNAESCIDCGKCAKKCHQGLDVDKVDIVRHVDCNLCGDCILVCPEKNTLQINRRNSFKWISPIAAVILVAAGISLGSLWELPTIEQKWYDEDTMKNALVFEQSGLKNVKCFGSSSAFANQMRKVDGVLGVATYVKEFRVKVWYDPDLLDEEKIQEAIFTPAKAAIRPISRDIDSVVVVSMNLDHFFDPLDFSYLQRLLGQQTEAVGLLSLFDCPPIVKIAFPSGTEPGDAELKSILESRKLTYEVNGTKNSVKLNYKVESAMSHETISRHEYVEMLFHAFGQQFNDRKSYSDDVLQVYEIPLGKNGALRNRFSYLVSHLSNDNGAVEFKTLLDSTYREVVHILFVDTMTTGDNIFRALSSDSLTVNFSNGEVRKISNMFSFTEEGHVIDK